MIGTGTGHMFDDEFQAAAHPWYQKPEDVDDSMVKTPNEMQTNKALDNAELDPTTGLGIDVAYKTASPLVTITDDDIDKAINVGLAAGPGTMAGVQSVTANTASRMKAAIMEGKGESAEAIRNETGWMKSKSDGRMKYEISDEAMKLKDRDWMFGDTGKLSEFVDHPELFKAYPSMKDINFKVADKTDPYIASYSHGSNTLTVNPGAVKGGDEKLLDILSHELQHAVQSREGFSLGSNPTSAFTKAINEVMQKIDSGGNKEELMSLLKDISTNSKDFANYMYQRTPGEVEANNVMVRRTLTNAQRKEVSPQASLDLMEGSPNPITGGTFMKEFNYPK